MADICPCGRPLHYTDPTIEAEVTQLVRSYGETVVVDVEGSRRAWRVPRHYIALHGLKAADVEQLADLYGWKEATR